MKLVTISEIVNKLKRDRSWVNRTIKTLGINVSKVYREDSKYEHAIQPRDYVKLTRKFLPRARKSDLSLGDIATKLNMDVANLFKLVERFNIKTVKKVRNGKKIRVLKSTDFKRIEEYRKEFLKNVINLQG